MWYKTTVYAALFVIAPYTVFTWYKELQHEHHHAPVYPHMHIRAKAYPWKENDCNIFDYHCKHDWHAAHKKGGH
jgi:hypothetical protein